MKFKKGDKVKVIGNIATGSMAKIIEVDSRSFPYKCKFKKPKNHHYEWLWLGEDELKLVEKKKEDGGEKKDENKT